MNSFFRDIGIRRRIFKRNGHLLRFPFYTPCFWARFLSTRHLARRAIFIHFLSLKCQLLLNQDRSSNFLFCLTSLIWRLTDLSFRSVFFIRSTLSKRHYYDPLQWRSCNLLRYKLLQRIRWEERHLQVLAGPTIGRRSCTGVQIK